MRLPRILLPDYKTSPRSLRFVASPLAERRSIRTQILIELSKIAVATLCGFYFQDEGGNFECFPGLSAAAAATSYQA